MDGPKIARLYYSTRDVCELLKIPAHTLRSWEKKFSILKPVKHRSGKRLFKPHDLEVAMLIKKLKDEGHSDSDVNRMIDAFDDPAVPVEYAGMNVSPQNKLPGLLSILCKELKAILEIIQE